MGVRKQSEGLNVRLEVKALLWYDMLSQEKTVWSPPPPSTTTRPPSMLQASVINVLTCIIDAWHYDNGSESTRGGGGVRVVWVCVCWGGGCNSVWLDTNRPSYEGRTVDRPLPKETIKQKMWIWHHQFRTEFISDVTVSAFLSSLHLSQCLSLPISVLISASSERSPRLVGRWRGPKTWYAVRQGAVKEVFCHTQCSLV